jgi:hypothetical protein
MYARRQWIKVYTLSLLKIGQKLQAKYPSKREHKNTLQNIYTLE